MSFRMIALTVLVLITVAAVGARIVLATEVEPATTAPGLTTLSAAATSPDASGAQPTPIEEALPYVTEGGFFAIVGFALGYASRKLLKLALILLALVFVAIQGLSAADVLTVDWDAAVALANEAVLNIKQDQSWTAWLQDRLPTAGGLLAGYALGFRRG